MFKFYLKLSESCDIIKNVNRYEGAQNPLKWQSVLCLCKNTVKPYISVTERLKIRKIKTVSFQLPNKIERN